MKILIYGFKPYEKNKKNISELIVKKIKKGVGKVIFDVRFDKKMYVQAIKKYKPNLVIGLGQHPRSRKIRIERKAINIKKISKKSRKTLIKKRGAKHYFTSLKLKKNKQSWISYNAGTYVCNYSMYVISDYCKHKNIRFGFIHIPKRYKVGKAARYIEKVLKSVLTS